MNKNNTILYLSSSPKDQKQLGVDKEFRAIYENTDRRFFNMFSVSNAQASDLQSIILSNNPEIIHFAGHGLAESIFFENSDNEGTEVPKAKFTNIFQNLNKKPRLIFLNACWTSKNIEQLANIIDFVIATEQKVADATAIKFSAKFYEFLSLNQNVRDAFNSAIDHFDIESQKEQVKMYCLWIHENADETKTFVKNSKAETKEKDEKITNLINIGEGNELRDINSFQGSKFGDISIKK